MASASVLIPTSWDRRPAPCGRLGRTGFWSAALPFFRSSVCQATQHGIVARLASETTSGRPDGTSYFVGPGALMLRPVPARGWRSDRGCPPHPSGAIYASCAAKRSQEQHGHLQTASREADRMIKRSVRAAIPLPIGGSSRLLQHRVRPAFSRGGGVGVLISIAGTSRSTAKARRQRDRREGIVFPRSMAVMRFRSIPRRSAMADRLQSASRRMRRKLRPNMRHSSAA
jgi:hypothetical protein